jgi:hypothetical protein
MAWRAGVLLETPEEEPGKGDCDCALTAMHAEMMVQKTAIRFKLRPRGMCKAVPGVLTSESGRKLAEQGAFIFDAPLVDIDQAVVATAKRFLIARVDYDGAYAA